ncbi:hypothetical protein COV18_06580 [Candidatus Woesearchaeota archaeon CG10_big_fil_rev_8_21_14_0_10_37_12]|nr:MAG: hypothetical protein COV18_06580 [Candidatus Woesearchaeota archaeon CG10_big_fil_rev_8_21_14_0_10_37_12]
MITLTKTFSREQSLFYARVWNDSEVNRGFGKWMPKIQNLLFLRAKNENKISVWYDTNELKSFDISAQKQIEKNPQHFDKLKEKFYKHWEAMWPYVSGKKKLSNINELEWFYNEFVDWWTPMAIFFTLPGNKHVPQEVRDLAMEIRKESEKYSDKGDYIYLDFIKEHYPEYTDLRFVLLPEELFLLKERKLTNEEVAEIKKRLPGCAILNDELILIDDLPAKLKEKGLQLEQLEIKETSELKGMCACKGTAQGTVRLILKKEQLKEFKQGEILVTEMTKPDFVPAMKQAAGIITDEGGITCHAAIVSRELGVPCIIGTKIATTVLKDGDTVEINADEGIVKILEK